MSTSTYTVSGMTCGHCVASVTEEVSQVPGVTDVNVDLASGGLTVSSETAVDDAAVRAAVEEAGYTIVTPIGEVSPAGGSTSGCGCGCS
ncbi:heavy-metal-associated domain-containing protein [Blastococcus sp. LR1]|uniref:heavy-metal-associated domain-containing protein n=1 Tax=Blastococcus sp. LR1 TaxID=2877000 RepID=UPI0027145155|nr:heavy-metal-associated domain-containing protein [Blastococcus sp. LR1]